jgi:hypothetical protein
MAEKTSKNGGFIQLWKTTPSGRGQSSTALQVEQLIVKISRRIKMKKLSLYDFSSLRWRFCNFYEIISVVFGNGSCL